MKAEIVHIPSRKKLKTLSTRTRIVAALLLVPGAGLAVAACSDHTKNLEEASEKKGREALARELRRSLEPHPQSPSYRGEGLESFVRVAGRVDKGKINGVSKDGWSEVTAYDSAGSYTKLRVMELGSDPCIKDAKGNAIGAPPPMYVVTDTRDALLCNDYYPKVDGDRLKCNDDHEAIQHKALALPGYWDDKGNYKDDPASFTLACISGAAAKCAHWGYVPWEKYTKAGSTEDGTELLPYYKACVHAARADYHGEGNGKSHTCGSTVIDLYDNLGIAKQAENSGWVFEAAWSKTGAFCAARPRYNVSSTDNGCLDGYKASKDCAKKCTPGAHPDVLLCNRVRQDLRTPSGENVCPGPELENCSCEPLGCTRSQVIK